MLVKRFALARTVKGDFSKFLQKEQLFVRLVQERAENSVTAKETLGNMKTKVYKKAVTLPEAIEEGPNQNSQNY